MSARKVIAFNRKASHEYFLEDRFEAGIQLLHKNEILKLEQKVKLKGYTIIPISVYLEKGLAKIEIALAKGKDLHDKRNAQKEKDAKREIEKAMKNRY